MIENGELKMNTCWEIGNWLKKKTVSLKSKGAGDAFVGAFVHFLNHYGKSNLDKAVRLATDYATLTVQYPGTQTSYLAVDKLDAKFKTF